VGLSELEVRSLGLLVLLWGEEVEGEQGRMRRSKRKRRWW